MTQDMMGAAVASSGPYVNHLYTSGSTYQIITQFFTGWMLFLTPNQQCQNTEEITRNSIAILIWCVLVMNLNTLL